MGEVFTVLPFQNTLATFQLSGADVVAALENGVSQVEEGAGRFPQVCGFALHLGPALPSRAAASCRSRSIWTASGRRSTPRRPMAWCPTASCATAATATRCSRDNGMNAYDFGPGLEEVGRPTRREQPLHALHRRADHRGRITADSSHAETGGRCRTPCAGPFRSGLLRCRKRKPGFAKDNCCGALALPYSLVVEERNTPQKRSCTHDLDHVAHLRTAAAKRAAYNTDRREISRMPLDVALDLGIFREDARKIAHQAVYGR
jgi:hypothetical protein